MARNNNLTDFLKDVADAIREKSNSSAPINPQDFPERIAAIETGGEQPDGTHTVQFIDVDGTILKTQYVADGGSATPPANPTREKCEFVKWLNAYSNITKDTDVFALYKSADGNSWYRVKAEAGDQIGIQLQAMTASPVTVHWGDGASDTATKRNAYTLFRHVYAEAFDGWLKVSSEDEYYITSTPEGSALVSEIVIGDKVTNLQYVARNLWNLTAIVIPETVTSITGAPFVGCTRLTTLILPDTMVSFNVSLSSGLRSLTYLHLSDGITSIPTNLIAGCYSLQSVSIPSGVTSIGNNAFQNCYSLQSVNIPSGVTSIGAYAFQGCYSLQSVNIPSGVTSIGNNAFQNCYSLQSVSIPSGVTSIGAYAFQNCYSLQSVNIPSGVTSIGNNAFQNCYSLQSVNIPSGVTSIGNNAFQNCYSLQSVSIPSGVTSIGAYAFQNCYNAAFTVDLSDITPASAYFQNCTRLTGAVTLNSTAVLGNGALGGTGISSIYAMSANLTHTAEPGPLEACPNLVRVELPNVAVVARTSLYNNPKLALVILGSNVTSIDTQAMGNCPALARAVVKAVTPPTLNAQAFQGSSALAGIYVPDDSVEAYKTATNWAAKADIIKPLSEFVE